MTASDDLNAVYARIPDVPCDGSCAAVCTGVPVGPAEAQRMRAAGAKLKGWRIPGDDLVELTAPIGHRCVALKDGACTVHDDRPAICRLYGAVMALGCPRGCRPELGHLRSRTGRSILRAAIKVPPDPPESTDA